MVFIDSMSVLTAVGARFHLSRGNYLILYIKDLFLRLSRAGVKTTLVWIPSHGDISGNESMRMSWPGCGSLWS